MTPRRSSRAPWAGRTVLITAGPTREHLDPIRFLSNASSGRMGLALAREARLRGAATTVVLGPVSVAPPAGVRVVRVVSARQMRAETLTLARKADAVIAAAAVSDWRFAQRFDHKIKRGPKPVTLKLLPNQDIIKEVARRRKNPGQVLVGFALETRGGLSSARRKLAEKGLDFVVLNGPETLESGRARITIVSRGGGVRRLPLLSKLQAARAILRRVEERWRA